MLFLQFEILDYMLKISKMGSKMLYLIIKRRCSYFITFSGKLWEMNLKGARLNVASSNCGRRMA